MQRYTEDELLLIAESVVKMDKVAETHRLHQSRFPDRPRSIDSIMTQRSNNRVKEIVHEVWEAGYATLYGSTVEEGDSPDPLKVKAKLDPSTGELSILKPRDGTWTKPADLLERAGIAFELDERGQPVPLHYTIRHIDLNEWGTAMKVGREKKPVVVPNWQCALKLLPRKDAPALKAMESVLERISEGRVHHPRVAIGKPDGNQLLELVLPDLHFGKLAHAAETGEDMDTGIIVDRMMWATESIVSRAQQNYGIGESLFIVGNDLLNANNEEGTTGKGTRQDIDSRLHRVLEHVMEACTHAIDRLAELGPVTVLLVPGNHDPEVSQAVARYLYAWYRHDGSIRVDTSPNPRKYHRHGKVLLGFTHGDSEKASQLPLIMADEAGQDWADTQWREWHLGHIHKAKEYMGLTTDEQRGVRVRHLSSLTGLDAWHHKMGYRAMKQADGFVWCPETGLRDIIVEQCFG